jgi:hypothetical protein
MGTRELARAEVKADAGSKIGAQRPLVPGFDAS